jgi:thiamine pyrophosphate-dependent acetolactate synthase large subunit-like protein
VRVYQAVAESLRYVGVDVLFGLMGDANMQYIAAFRDGGGRFVAAVVEGGAVSMCDGWSRLSGRVGVATVTHGPGVTNAITALTEAVRAHTPMVLLVSETGPVREHPQRIDLRAVAGLTGAGFATVLNPTDVALEIEAAVRAADRERRPVMLDIPVIQLATTIDAPAWDRPFRLAPPRAITPDPDLLDEVLGVALAARRPVILAGRGALRAGAGPELRRLADRLPAALATTLAARGLFRGHPRDLGLFGTLSHAVASEAITASDCILAFGAGLTDHTTLRGDLLRDKVIVQCDRDERALGVRHPGAIGVLADARELASAMTAALDGPGDARERRWTGELESALAARDPAAEFVDGSGSETIDPRTAMLVLDEVLPPGRVVVTDVGRFHPAPWRYLHSAPGDFAYTTSFGSIGLGLATAVGAALARPDRLTVAVVGDGGGMMGLMELIVAVRERARLAVVVVDDAAYGAEWTKLAGFGLNPEYSLLPGPDLAGVARAMGARARTVRTRSDFDAFRPLVDEAGGPVLIDVKADPSVDPGVFVTPSDH